MTDVQAVGKRIALEEVVLGGHEGSMGLRVPVLRMNGSLPYIVVKSAGRVRMLQSPTVRVNPSELTLMVVGDMVYNIVQVVEGEYRGLIDATREQKARLYSENPTLFREAVTLATQYGLDYARRG